MRQLTLEGLIVDGICADKKYRTCTLEGCEGVKDGIRRARLQR